MIHRSCEPFVNAELGAGFGHGYLAGQAMEMMYEMESLANFPLHEPVTFSVNRGTQPVTAMRHLWASTVEIPRILRGEL